MGYVKSKGTAGQKVPDTETIYSTPKCITILRAGKTSSSDNSTDNGGVEKVTLKGMEESLKNKTGSFDASSILSGSTGLLGDSIKLDDDFTTKLQAEEEKYSLTNAIKNAVENNGGVTQNSVVIQQSDLDALMEERVSKIDQATEKIESMTFKGVSVGEIITWFENIEMYLNALPDLVDFPEDVYEVENKDGGWVYTGKTEEMDAEWNKKLNEQKKKLCKTLNVMVNKATSELNDKLNELLKTNESSRPFMLAIHAIQRVPSLTTIIKWATSVIDFLLAFYKLVFGLFQMVMQMLEVIIIRFPQLLNSLMKAITKLDCPIDQAKPIKVNINLTQSTSPKDSKGNRKKKEKKSDK